MEATLSQDQQKDVRPILPRTGTNSWSRAEQIRDQLHDGFIKACTQEGIEAQVLKSVPFQYPPWVRFESWIRAEDPSLTERAWAEVKVQPKPYHRFPFEFNLVMMREGEKDTFTQLREFTGQHTHDLVRYLLGRRRKPKFKRLKLRQSIAEFWRPKNKVIAVRSDRRLVAMIAGAILFISGGAAMGGEEILISLGVLLAVGAVVMHHYLKLSIRYVRTEGKPYGEPRNLIRVDSWQTVIFGLAGDCPMVREHFLKTLETPPVPHFRYQIEKVWYWGLDGEEERDQIVLTSARGIVFCQIYQYGKDLYAGWDGHVNTGQWVERWIAKGVDRISKELVSIHVVEPGTQPINEYDVIDLSCLMEWTHAQLVKLLKELVEERKIDQEIDFKILRGERQKLTVSEKEKKRATGFLELFRRTG